MYESRDKDEKEGTDERTKEKRDSEFNESGKRKKIRGEGKNGWKREMIKNSRRLKVKA